MTRFLFDMNIFFYENYKELYPQLTGRQLTDQLILRALTDHGSDISHVRIERTEKGKPLVVGHPDGTIHVSVSHCRDTFACLVADINCGLDIQEPRTINQEKVAGRFFGPDEIDYVKAQGTAGFYQLWTRKEAYAKYLGTGIIEVLRGTEVLRRRDVYFTDSILPNGMYCSICMCMERSK